MNCKVCGNKISALHKLFFNQAVGVECQSCHSILSHSRSILLLLCLALAGFVFLLTQAIRFSSLFWWIAVAIGLAFIGSVQLLAPLRVVYENKHRR